VIAVLNASIFHARQRPRRNAFRYGAYYLAVPLTELSGGRPASLFSIDGTNLFSLHAKDYGCDAPRAWIENILAEWKLSEADGETVLVTMPRILGYVFNPVNFWFCLDRDGRLRAVLSEVNNTFGERHCYLSFRDDHATITPKDVLHTRKIFHVSPFMDVKGEYRFRFCYTPERTAIDIDLFDDEGLLLSTTLSGEFRPLTSMRLLRAVLLNPLLPFKVIALIHYQALRLYLKKIRYFRKPLPPPNTVSL